MFKGMLTIGLWAPNRVWGFRVVGYIGFRLLELRVYKGCLERAQDFEKFGVRVLGGGGGVGGRVFFREGLGNLKEA